jgi:type IV pilus assembly protein PilW
MNALHRQHGMSLIELMIAMTLGLMLTIGIATLFTQTRESFNQDEQVATMQANLRFAMDTLVQDITMAGFVGQILDPTTPIVDPGISMTQGQDCANWFAADGANWAVNLTDPLQGLSAPSDLEALVAFRCIGWGSFQNGTDVIAVKRLRSEPITPTASTVHLTENGLAGCLYADATPTNPGICTVPVGAGAETRELSVNVYHVRNFSVEAGDGIPTLCRNTLAVVSGSPTMTSRECLVEGIEHLAIQYGVDTSGDGVANLYVAEPTAAQRQQLTSVRIHLVARSLRPQQRYNNNKTYVLGNRTVTVNDSFYRRAASTTVVLRNPTNLRNLN